MMFQLPLATAAVALLVLPAAAQDAPSNGGVPIYDITPRALPTLTPTVPVLPVPTPRATPTPRAVPRAAPTARATPVSRATPAPRPSPTPRAAEVAPSPVPTPTEAPVPAPLQDVGPSPAPSPDPLATPEAAPSAASASEAVAPVANDAGTPWWIWFLAGLVVAGLVAWLIGRMRRGRTEAPVSVEPVAAPAPQPVVPPAPAPAPAPVAPLPPVRSPVIAPPAAPVPPSLPPRFLDFQLAPLRVALQDERVLLDFDLGVGNGTDVAADEVRIATLLLTANAQQDEQIAAFLDREPGGGLEPFELASGDQRMVEATMTLPRHMLNVVTARERPFFVPIMVIDARYRWADGRESRTSAAFMVGQGLPNGRLSPVFLDRGDRTVERLEARLHGEIRRT